VAITRSIELRTEVPGPRSREIMERLSRVVATPLAINLPIVAQEARGALLTDVDGNTFVDFTGGVGVLNVGHAHPQVVSAIQEQAARFTHTDFTIVPYEVYVEASERLLAVAPFTGPAKAAFFNSGAEAVENAVKIARLATGRAGVVGFTGAFHGRTLMAVTLTAKADPYKRGLGPFAPEVYRAPFPNLYRGPDARTALAELEDLLETQLAPETVAAIVFEPQQGEGGFLPAPQEFVEGLRRIADRHGIVLVADEVQTGFGRTGRLPLSGVLGKAAIMDAPHEGAIGGTYVGNPVALAAAVAVLDVIEQEGLVERAGAIGDTIRTRMLAWQERWPQIGDVRGLGAMLAIELVDDPVTKAPASKLATAVIDAATQRGLLLLKAGMYGNCIRVLCPLVISDAELDEALAAWEDALAATLS
jgi:4-aminobutyrate aminotransferase / (S)-3-amino-2-methylpropionate transaminase / 5-aminovalerate transaminase